MDPTQYNNCSKILSFCDSLHDFEGGRCLHNNLTPTLSNDPRLLEPLPINIPTIFAPKNRGRVASVEHKCVDYISDLIPSITNEEIVVNLQPKDITTKLGLNSGDNIGIIIDCGFRSRFGDLLTYFNGNQLINGPIQDSANYYNLNTITSYWDEATKVSKCSFHVDIIPGENVGDDINKINIPETGFSVNLDIDNNKTNNKSINTLEYIGYKNTLPDNENPYIFDSQTLEAKTFDFSVRSLCKWVSSGTIVANKVSKNRNYDNFFNNNQNTYCPLHIKRSMDAGLVMTTKYLNLNKNKYQLFVKKTTETKGKKPTHSLSLPIDYESVIKLLRDKRGLVIQNTNNVNESVVKMINEQEKLLPPQFEKVVLITCDNLCYLRAKLENVPAILFVSGVAKIYKGEEVTEAKVIESIESIMKNDFIKKVILLIDWVNEIKVKLKCTKNTQTDELNNPISEIINNFYTSYLNFEKFNDELPEDCKSCKFNTIKNNLLSISTGIFVQIDNLLSSLFTINDDSPSTSNTNTNNKILQILGNFLKIYDANLCTQSNDENGNRFNTIIKSISDILENIKIPKQPGSPSAAPLISSIHQTLSPEKQFSFRPVSSSNEKNSQPNLKYYIFIRNLINVINGININTNTNTIDSELHTQTYEENKVFKKLKHENIKYLENDALNKILSIFNIYVDDLFKIIPNIIDTDIDEGIKDQLTRSTMKECGEVITEVKLYTKLGGTRGQDSKINNLKYIYEIFAGQRDIINKIYEDLNKLTTDFSNCDADLTEEPEDLAQVQGQSSAQGQSNKRQGSPLLGETPIEKKGRSEQVNEEQGNVVGEENPNPNEDVEMNPENIVQNIPPDYEPDTIAQVNLNYLDIFRPKLSFFYARNAAIEGRNDLYNILCELDSYWRFKDINVGGGNDIDKATREDIASRLNPGIGQPSQQTPGINVPIFQTPGSLPTQPASQPYSQGQFGLIIPQPSNDDPDLNRIKIKRYLSQYDIDLLNKYKNRIYELKYSPNDLQGETNIIDGLLGKEQNNKGIIEYYKNLYNSSDVKAFLCELEKFLLEIYNIILSNSIIFNTELNIDILSYFSDVDIEEEVKFNEFKNIFKQEEILRIFGDYFGFKEQQIITQGASTSATPLAASIPAATYEAEMFEYIIDIFYNNPVHRALLIHAFHTIKEGEGTTAMQVGGGSLIKKFERFTLKDYHRKYYTNYYNMYY